MVPDPQRSSLGLEYFCQRGDSFWNRADAELISQATRELELLGLVKSGDVLDGCVFRVPNAYPVYDKKYSEFLDRIKSYLKQFKNLQSIGRNGLHRYNNQDHAMLTGIAAVRNAIRGETIDLWSINADSEYLEETSEPQAHASVGVEPEKPMMIGPRRMAGFPSNTSLQAVSGIHQPK